MKKKTFTFIIVACMVFFAGSKTSWGQNGVLLPQNQQLPEIRRLPVGGKMETDTIHGPGDVNRAFGAGESSHLSGASMAWPNGDAFMNSSIQIGSYYSKNAVIGIYDQGGLSAGALHDIRLYGDRWNSPAPDAYNSTNVKYYEIKYLVSPADTNTVGAPVRGPAAYHCPGTLVTFIDGGYGGRGIEGHAVLEKTYSGVIAIGAVLRPYFNEATMKYIVPVYNHVSMETQAKWNAEVDKQTAFSFNVETADTVYTSTRKFKDAVNGNIDDGKPLLLQFKGEGTEDKFKTTLDKAEYIRPTTVLLSGTQSLNKITVGDIEWYAAFFKSTKIGTDIIGPFKGYNAQGCGHLSGWVAYQRDNYTFDTIRTENSKKYVDGAVRLLNNADVCVSGNVLDSTKTQYSIGTYTNTETKAMLVVPGAKDKENGFENFRLKVGGNFNMLVTQDSGRIYTNPLDAGYMYMASAGGVGPGAPFPTAQVPLKLSNGTTTWNEVQGLINYNHPRGSVLTDVNNADAEKRIPYFATKGSVFGVRGAYNGGKADGSGDGNIHTQNIKDEDVASIIEIGSATTNQDKFHVYSSGMLKNFRSDCKDACETLVVGIGGKAPEFKISGLTPLYIINDGNCCEAGIRFNAPGVTNLNTAITGAEDGGALHIQANKFIEFLDQPVAFAQAKDNEVKVLSDNGYIYSNTNFEFTNADTAHLTLWAKGPADANRGCTDLDCNTGAIQIDKDFKYEVGGANGKSLLLMRSENDDVLVKGKFDFKNEAGTAESGEMMVQAGQDVRIDGDVTLNHDGLRSMLFEAKKTIAFGGNFIANVAKTKTDGDLTIKAGYDSFLPTADNGSDIMKNWGTGTCVEDGYINRDACQANNTTGGDIWFKKDATFTLTPPVSEFVDTYIRAYNSIHIDGNFTHTLTSAKGGLVDTTMLYAETGNIEAMKAGDVTFDVTNAGDSVYLLIQAGNGLGNPCSTTNCYKNNEWDGNILFCNGKSLTINQNGVGPTLISAARDIENQEEAPFTFNYTNTALGTKDNILVTAGRHIETHAPYNFNYEQAGTDVTNSITMQAGHLAGGCNWTLCKEPELGSTLTNGFNYTDNQFSKGGNGNGSILMFAPLNITYQGKGDILLTALNGDIETDPYLHGGDNGYGTQAVTTINHDKSTGKTTLEAIDIRLHDKFNFDAGTTAASGNNLYLHAYDSILTRDFTYTSGAASDGSVYITADKFKSNSCKDNIRQGHIVLGYGADCNDNTKDIITFDFNGNTSATGANVYIKAGYEGFNNHSDKKNLYGGNITFDNIQATMANPGNRTQGGYMEISTPNGNIWGKDALNYKGYKGDLLVDAGLGSVEDPDAIAWANGDDGAKTSSHGISDKNLLNTRVLANCGSEKVWRTGNIMMKGGTLDFNNMEGNATFRTRQGYIDTYDKFDVSNMKGQLLKYAHVEDGGDMQYSDVSERDFAYTPAGGSVYFGADDNIMLNYGNSNGAQKYTNNNCPVSGSYLCSENGLVSNLPDAYLSQSGENKDKVQVASFNVHKNGYLWYQDESLSQYTWMNKHSMLYRGGSQSCNKSGIAGTCATPSNGARDLTMNFSSQTTGGLATVANNYIDYFTKFTYNGGQGSGIAAPAVGSIVGENVTGYGLFIKSRNQGANAEDRRATCFDCGSGENWPVVTFHDDARIHAENQKVNLEGPVVEFFGHAELDAESNKGSKTDFAVKADSLIFHDSAVFDGLALKLLPFTSDDAARAADDASQNYRLGVIRTDKNMDFYKGAYRQAITMNDRRLPVLELGYQRCNEPTVSPNMAPNTRSGFGLEDVPTVGGDVIVAVKNGFTLPIFNTVVANHARISFVSDSLDGPGNPYLNAFVRTDLLRIRNKVEFYDGEGTGNDDPKNRKGLLEMTSTDQMEKEAFNKTGIFPKHLHMEPGSELSIPGENELIAIATTTIGGYGEIHENVFIKANGTIAPGHASLMEQDCTSGRNPGMLKVHNLTMEKNAEFRVSLGDQTSDNSTGIDTLYVEDTVRFNGKIPLYVLTDVKSVEPGCYTFLIYNDKDGISKEYVKNFTLMIDRYEDNYFSLDYSTPGEVRLCVSKSPNPIMQQYVELPAVEGVNTTPYKGGKHYIGSQEHFTFYATYTGSPMKVMADGYYSGKHIEILGEKQSDGSYKYVLYYIVEPWTVSIGPDLASNFVNNEAIAGNKVWAYKNMLYVNVGESDIASIYTMTGVLYKRIEIPAGNSSFTLDRGMYVVTLKDGSVHKIVIK